MSIKTYLKRLARFVVKGEPRKEIYVNVASVKYGQILAGKNILITGGSSGIGLAIAKKCALEGAQVLITGRNKEKLIVAREEIGVEKCKTLAFDVSDISNIHTMMEEVLSLLNGKLDAVVNNAGIYYEKDFFAYTPADWENMCNTNLKGVYFLTQNVCKYFINAKAEGNIVFISSERGIIGDFNIYGITKAGINNFVMGLTKKFSNNNIRVNGIAPGMVASGINGISSCGNLSVSGRKRVLRADEIAEVAVFLLSDASKCINGEVIACNEGNALA